MRSECSSAPARAVTSPWPGVGEPYGLCIRHGHEERNHRLAARDAKAKPAAPPVAPRPVTNPTRPLSAVVGARPTPTPIAPSRPTEVAKESAMPPKTTEELRLRPDADAHPNLCRIDGCDADKLQARGLCPTHYSRASRAKVLHTFALPPAPWGARRAAGASPAPAAPTLTDAERRELEQLRASDARLRDALAASADKLQVLVGVLNLDPSKDLAKQARDIAAWVAVAVEAANATGVTSPGGLRQAIDDALAEESAPVVRDIVFADLPLGRGSPVLSPLRPKDSAYHVRQGGGRDLGVLVGHLDPAGLFRVTDGPRAGSAFGCLYSVEPVERPVLGEPGPDEDVWVRTSIDEVTPTNIHTADGGRYRRSEWSPGRFARPARPASFAASAAGDDIPF